MNTTDKQATINEDFMRLSFCHIGSRYAAIKCWVNIDIEHVGGKMVNTDINVETETFYDKQSGEVLIDDEQELYDARYGVSEEEHLAITKAVREYANNPENQTHVQRPGFHTEELVYSFIAKRDLNSSGQISDELAEIIIKEGVGIDHFFSQAYSMRGRRGVFDAFDLAHDVEKTTKLFAENSTEFLKMIDDYAQYAKDSDFDYGDSVAEFLTYSTLFSHKGIKSEQIQQFLDNPEDTSYEYYADIANNIVAMCLSLLANAYDEYEKDINDLT